MNKILINGRVGSGKDTLADYLVEKYGYKKIAFADGVYEIAKEYFGMKNKDRKLLQQIGEYMREIDKDVWVKRAYKKAEEYEKVVISDCRRENEYTKGIELGYVPIRINANENLRIDRVTKRDGSVPDISLLNNKSEIGADDLAYIELYNEASLDDLYKQIDRLIKEK